MLPPNPEVRHLSPCPRFEEERISFVTFVSLWCKK